MIGLWNDEVREPPAVRGGDMEKRKKVIRDPLYGYIEISDEEKEIIELPVFQRLRRVSQLSLADLVYPNATHNRFSHSLGVMHLAKIVSKYLETSEIKEKILSNENSNLIIWAGLLHDIGHLPFSHVCEPVFAYFIDGSNNWKNYHVDIGCRIIKSPDFGIKDILGNDNAEKICKIIKGKSDRELSIHLVKIMTGPCSIDRLDYLRRDAYHAGTREYAIIDAQRILTSLEVCPDDLYTAPVFKRKSLYALEGVILSYFYMYRAIYYHRAVRAAYLLFQEILWDAFERYNLKNKLGEHGLDRLPSKDWVHFDEHFLLTILREIGHQNPEIREQLDELFLCRKLPKLIEIEEEPIISRIFEFLNNVSYKEKIEKEREIAEKLEGFGVKRIFLDSPMIIPYPRSILKEEAKIYILKDGKASNIAEDSPYLKSLEPAAEKQLAARIYVLPGELRNNNNFVRELYNIIMEELS